MNGRAQYYEFENRAEFFDAIRGNPDLLDLLTFVDTDTIVGACLKEDPGDSDFSLLYLDDSKREWLRLKDQDIRGVVREDPVNVPKAVTRVYITNNAEVWYHKAVRAEWVLGQLLDPDRPDKDDPPPTSQGWGCG